MRRAPKATVGPIALRLSELAPESLLRLRIFAFKMLMVIPVSLAIAGQRGEPLLRLMAIFCFWHGAFAALAAVVQQQRVQLSYFTAWDEAAALYGDGAVRPPDRRRSRLRWVNFNCFLIP